MKKVYQKPAIIFEEFSLCTNIAGDCDVKTQTPVSGDCGYQFGSNVVFLESVSGCVKKVKDEMDQFNGICYHVPLETKDLFNS